MHKTILWRKKVFYYKQFTENLYEPTNRHEPTKTTQECIEIGELGAEG